MTEQAKEARRAYQREWRKKNREKCREYNVRHWEKIAANMADDDEEQTGEGKE